MRQGPPTPEPGGKHKFMIYLPEETYEQLRRIAFDERTSINKLVIAAVDDALAKRQKPKPKTTKKGG